MVISDINMPRMDGLTLLAKLQDEATRFSTIIVSAYGDMANIRTAMNRGAFDFLTKPIDFADFETTIARRSPMSPLCATRACARPSPSARTPRSRAISRPISRAAWLPTLMRSRPALSGARSRRLFTDIAGFTPLVETLEPSQLARLLSEYLERHDGDRLRARGTVAKIIGDAIHVLFGAPADQPDAARARDRLRARA